MNWIFEKLLPARWWKKPVLLNEEQFWTALAAPENPQTKAVLHVAQDKFVGYMRSAASEGPAEKRLRELDRAMAMADYLEEVQTNFVAAPAEVKRRAGAKQEGQKERQN